MKLIIFICALFTVSNSFAESNQSFEDQYYRLLTKYIEAQTQGSDIYRYSDGSEVTNPADKIKIQAERDCKTWRANKAFTAYIVDNFKAYEASKDKPFFIKASKAEWTKDLKDLDDKLNNSENNCQ